MTTEWLVACRVAVHRLGIRFTAVLGIAAALSVLVVAGLERRASPVTAADNTLLGVVFGLGIPLCSYFIAAQIATSRRWLESTGTLARHGANRRVVALSFYAVTAAVSSVVCGGLALVGVIGARSISDPSLLRDGITSAGLGVLAGIVYAAWFMLGSTFGRRGGGRFVALAVDWLLGSSTAAVALPLPRAHLRNVLGAEPLLEMTQRQASLALLVLASLYVTLAVWRTPP